MKASEQPREETSPGGTHQRHRKHNKGHTYVCTRALNYFPPLLPTVVELMSCNLQALSRAVSDLQSQYSCWFMQKLRAAADTLMWNSSCIQLSNVCTQADILQRWAESVWNSMSAFRSSESPTHMQPPPSIKERKRVWDRNTANSGMWSLHGQLYLSWRKWVLCH